MSLRNLKNNELNTSISTGVKKNELTPVRVFSVILDKDHPKYTGDDSIGTIFYGKVDLNESSPNLDNLNRALPLFSFIKYYPLQNEIVLILSATSRNIYSDIGGDNAFISTYYLPNINLWNNSQHNALPLEETLKSRENSQEASIGIQQNNVEKNTINLGEYFTEKDNIKSLQPFEGDLILEGRFGNSIRMGATTPSNKPNNWSSTNNIGDPITIISNGQVKTSGDTVLENINETPSSIYFLSNQSINNFIPASINVQSIGATFTPPKTTQALIEDTPDPPIVVSSEPIYFPPEAPELVIEEEVPIQIIPAEPRNTGDSYDPIFALLDEAVEEGEITYESEVFEIASSEPDEEDEIETDLPTEGGSVSSIESRREAKSIWKSGGIATIYNKINQPLVINQPSEDLSLNYSPSSRIKYLWLHTTGTSTSATPVDVALMHLSPNGNNWKTMGYHWLIPRTGRGAVRLYSDSVVTNGVGGKISRDQSTFGVNSNAVNISWMGGYNGVDITPQQAYTLRRLVFNYLKKYPDIQIGGHNQMGRKGGSDGIPGANSCPIFYVPYYCELLNIPERNIFRGGYFANAANNDKYRGYAKTVFDRGQ